MNSGYSFIFATVTFIVLGQLLLKFGASTLGTEPSKAEAYSSIIVNMFMTPAILGGLFFAGLASICWVIALTKMSLSAAYPFMALPIVGVLILSPLIFGETVLLQQWIGVFLVVIGLYFAAV